MCWGWNCVMHVKLCKLLGVCPQVWGLLTEEKNDLHEVAMFLGKNGVNMPMWTILCGLPFFDDGRECISLTVHMEICLTTHERPWAFRKQRRAVLVAMKFSLEWLAFPGGVVKNESPLKRGFLTTFKVVGQTNIDNAFYLICQGNFGPRVGNNGFFYIPRGIFNLYVTGDAYIFIDAGAYMTLRGHRRNLYAARILPKKSWS
ncbi:hypothetical protein C3747_138g49 [Trypanosoma cruzi]|uniref:Uncharacterized protein n=1 Tax=Trypanosoma cruzi TaxID=5693 RepID=A0A2V2WA48_TRYCR|nr:hypothetical protein C3747_138g49 [Trypanosoma cruzi]